MSGDAPQRLHHGGGLDAAAERYRIPKADWLDLSTGINPVPYPVANLDPASLTRLPDRAAEAALVEAARTAYGVHADARVVAAPGTQLLIQLLPRLTPPGRVAVLGPTYNEHAACWRAAGHDVAETPLAEAPPGDCGTIIVVNPNNPDGHRHDPARLWAWLEAGRTVVVDEAFADADPTLSIAGSCGRPGLVVLRSFGKFFGLAGLRLGFALTDADRGRALVAALGPWGVGGPALEIGTRALADADWIAGTRRRLAADAARLDAVMAPAVNHCLGGTALFRLYDTGERDLYDHLAQEGILGRAFIDRPGLLRLGLPADDTGFRRLAASLF